MSAPEHQAPERARAYLITDAQVAEPRGPLPGPGPDRRRAARAAGTAGGPQMAAGAPATVRAAPRPVLGQPTRSGPRSPTPGPGGAGIPDLMAATGMTRPTLYRHLRVLAEGQATRVARGSWRAASPPGHHAP